MSSSISSTTVWVRPDSRAAYPSLAAARQGLREAPPDLDQVSLRRYEVPAAEAKVLSGVLTNEQGRIPRSLPKRVLDGACALGSFAGTAAAWAGALCCASSLLGLFIAGDLLEAGGELGLYGFRQASRALTGESNLATLPAQERAKAYFDQQQPTEMIIFDGQGTPQT